MTFYFADVMPDGRVRACFAYDPPEVGPPVDGTPDPQLEAQTEGTLVPLAAPINWAGPTPTSVLHMADGVQTWIETAALSDLAASAGVSIDAQADAARLTVSPPGRDLEYTRAEAQARPYAAANYPDPVPSCVASWAAAKRWTNGGTPWTGKQAADDIIATADAWYAALDAIRDLRLDAKQHALSVTSSAEINAVVTQFNNDLAAIMEKLK
jgi:hypothetical protein